MTVRIPGRCLCGAVHFETEFKDGPAFGVCHCSMCQHWNGGPGLASEFVRTEFGSAQTLSWYQSSDWAERGFCGTCGSSLFYRLKDMPDVLFIQLGCLDLPDDTHLAEHIFYDEKPAYYDFADQSPRLSGAEFLARMSENQNEK
jgi:hypothetical protein